MKGKRDSYILKEEDPVGIFKASILIERIIDSMPFDRQELQFVILAILFHETKYLTYPNREQIIKAIDNISTDDLKARIQFYYVIKQFLNDHRSELTYEQYKKFKQSLIALKEQITNITAYPKVLSQPAEFE